MGFDIVRDKTEAVEKIRKCILAAQDRKKIYADPKRQPIDFSVGDKVFLKVAPIKGIMRFGKKGKLNPRFIGPYEILEKLGKKSLGMLLIGSVYPHNYQVYITFSTFLY